MDKEGRNFLYELLEISAPTGAEQRVQRHLYKWAESFAHEIHRDFHGNMAVVINPNASRRVMLAGHCDRIGFMVMEIDESGYLRMDQLGGLDMKVVPGAEVVIHGRDGNIPGVFGYTATHYQGKDDREKTPKLEDLWVDIGAKDQEEAEKLLRLGAYATFKPRVVELLNGKIAAPAIDNTVGLWAVMETARRLADADLDVALYCVSTVQEEIGSRGAESAARAIVPHIAVAVDTTLALDDPSKPDKKTSPKTRLGQGPTISHGPNTNPAVELLFENVATDNKIPYQKEAHADLEGNDSKSMQVAGSGAAAASIGIPIRNMHTGVEVVTLSDVEDAAQLLTEFVRAIKPDMDFRPCASFEYQEEVPRHEDAGSPGFGAMGQQDPRYSKQR